MNEDLFKQMLDTLMVPDTYRKKFTLEYLYWFRSLLHKIDSSLVFRGIPDSWDNDFFMLCLWVRGYVTVFDTARWGISFQPCTVGGPFDFYYQPTIAQVTNPYYAKRLTIGKDCEMLKITPDAYWRGGILDIIDYYATKLAEISKAIDVGLINAKMPLIVSASNEAQQQMVKKIYDKVQQGESLVVWNDSHNMDEIIPSKEPFEIWNNEYTKTYIVPQLLEDMQSLLNSFYEEIGIPVADTEEKRAHLLQTEVDFTAAQSQARISCWVETINECLRKINEHFGLNMEVEYAQRETDSEGDGDMDEDRE